MLNELYYDDVRVLHIYIYIQIRLQYISIYRFVTCDDLCLSAASTWDLVEVTAHPQPTPPHLQDCAIAWRFQDHKS